MPPKNPNEQSQDIKEEGSDADTQDELSSSSESEDEGTSKKAELAAAVSGQAEDEDLAQEAAFEEMVDQISEVFTGDVHGKMKLIEKINSHADGRFQDILPQIIDGRKFIIDGDSLLLYALETKGLSMDIGGQTLHVIYIVENFLLSFLSRGLNFVVTFFKIWNKGWSEFPHLYIIRNGLRLHLRHNQSKFAVLETDSLWGEEFFSWIENMRPGFIMMSTSLPEILQRSEKQDLTPTNWLHYFTLSQAFYCDFLYLDVVDIGTVHSTPHSMMAMVFVNCNRSRRIHEQFKMCLNDMQHIVPMSTDVSLSFDVSVLPEPSIKISCTVFAAASLLQKASSKNSLKVVKAVLLSLAMQDHMPLKMRGFKGLPNLCSSVLKVLSDFWKEMANVFHRLSCDEELLPLIDWRLVSDLWQGTFFQAVFHAISEAGSIEQGELDNLIASRYEELVGFVDKFIVGKEKIQPYPIEHICEGNCTGHVLEKPSLSQLSPSTAGPKLIPSSCKLLQLFAGELANDKRFFLASDTNECREKDAVLEKYHWHNKKPLTDEYDRITDNAAKDAAREREVDKRWSQSNKNRLARFHTLYGLSLEGRSAVKAIVANSSTKTQTSGHKKIIEKPKSQAKGKLNKKEKFIEENNKRIMESKQKQLKERLKSFSSNFSSLMLKGDFGSAVEKCDVELHRAGEFSHFSIELLFMKAKACYGMWNDECHRRVCDKNDFGAKELFLVIREILKIVESGGQPLDLKQKKSLASWLYDLGFQDLAQIYDLPEPSAKSSKSDCELHLNYVEFQLKKLGPELIRDSGGKPDSRVEGFFPDPWQVKLFDIIDKNQSAVVVAPTSSGKTYASYYCMEKVLRNNDEDVLVYVCPTKALVNQVYATIYARFKKNLPAGKTLLGVFTKDYKENVQNCQILVTIPECMELLLISPRSENWTKKIKYVIFDEVHCLLSFGGLTWENCILLIRCPFLALSATIHKPENFCAWLQKVEDAKRSLAEKFNISNRPLASHKVNLVMHLERHNHLLKNVMTEDGSIQHVHPYSFLNLASSEDYSGIPQHISLSPDEALELYQAMGKVLAEDKIQEVSPLKYFKELCPSGFLSMQAVQKFSQDLRTILEKEGIEKQVKVLDCLKKMDYYDVLTGNLPVVRNIPMVLDALKQKGMLPALMFSYNRSMVEKIPVVLLHYLRDIDDFTEDEDTDIESASEDESKKSGTNQKGHRRYKGKRYKRKLGILRGPSMLKSEGSLRGEGHTDEKVVEFIEHRLIRAGWKATEVLPSLMRRGLAKHHAGMNNKERSAVEMLFRLKILNFVSATGTLALGIHMPCKTVVVAGDSPFLNVLEFNQMSGRAGRRGFDKEGNVIFYGVDKRKMETLMTGNLPELVGNFPLSVTLVLRLLLLVSDATLEGVATEQATNEALARAYCVLENGLRYQYEPSLKDRMRYFVCFGLQFLLHLNMVTPDGFCTQDALFITHMHHHEPGSFAFYYLLQTGALDALCSTNKDGSISIKTLLDLMVVLNFLFARIPLNKYLLSNTRRISLVVLPSLPKSIHKSLQDYNREVLLIFKHYFMSVTDDIKKKLGDETKLPLSQLDVQPDKVLSEDSMGEGKVTSTFKHFCTENQVCSVFASMSGNSDQNLFPDSGAIGNIRDDLNVNVIPTLKLDFPCNSYALDFFKHGDVKAMITDNGLGSGQHFALLKDFMLLLNSIKISLTETLEPDSKLLRALQEVSDVFARNFVKAYNIRGYNI